MNSLTDQYYSRLLAVAKENNNIKTIKNIVNDQIEAEMNDGSVQIFEWGDIINYKNFISKK